ncbi:LysR family transcriptional regulator [uncultured Cohaesibacter sp.]|uniref:LysR family transcriptional regulator n=1 Tax=uncultured Cohaesibacter sp. TaxID=1002546 RepID=UPI0029C76EA9|nr:LysR family transcriptional regulator [uncultured Cohaesibacter sp.]
MEFRQLRNFIQVIELSSITAAAERLNIAQPALSRQVKALEEELNVALLRRHGRGVVPTEEGIRLARRAKVILEDMQDIASDISGSQSTLSGTVTLGLPPTVSDILATHLITRTMELFPNVKLRIVSGFSGHVQDWLLRGKVDLGVAYEGHKPPSIRTQPIIIEQLFLIQSTKVAEHLDGVPITASDAFSQPLILPNPEHGLRSRIATIAAKIGCELDVKLEIDILPTMIAFVERGLGGTILPLVSVRDHINARRLIARPIIDQPMDRTLVLMTALNRPTSRLTTSFAEFVTKEVQQMVTSGQWPGTTL